jgi:hypothetical protein
LKIYGPWDSDKEWPLEDVLAHVGKGWHPLVIKLIEDLEQLGWNGRLAQIKEKFGGLRFYIGDSPIRVDVIGVGSFSKEESNDPQTKLYARIRIAEDDSFHICEWCGKPGTTGNHGHGYWILTLCPECAEKNSRGIRYWSHPKEFQ